MAEKDKQDSAGTADAVADQHSAGENEPEATGSDLIEQPPSVEPTTGATLDQLATLRDLIVLAHPDIIPELLTGNDAESLLASVGSAREAFGRLESQLLQQREADVGLPVISPFAGTSLDLDAMSPAELLRAGLRERDGSVSARAGTRVQR